MPMKPCLDCSRLHRNEGSRCGACQTRYNIARGSSTARGYGSRWKTLRDGVLRAYVAANGLVCPGYNRESHEVEESALTVDHITPKAHGGSDDVSNLQVLCKSCNSGKRDRVKSVIG